MDLSCVACQNADGNLCCVFAPQAVSCLVFSDSGGVLVSCGEDTLVCAWLLTEVLDTQRDHQAAAAAAAMSTARVEPLHTWWVNRHR